MDTGDPDPGGTALAEAFLRDGFVKIEGAVDTPTARACADLLWQETGCDPGDQTMWTRPVHRVGGMAQPLFAAAGPPPYPAVPLELERADGAYPPVGSAIRRGLGTADVG